jgi:hypothetical protein
MIKKLGLILLVVFALALVLGCSQEFGKIDQGRVIAYDKDKKTVTLVRDKNEDAKNPDYATLPPHVYALPEDPNFMGPEPKPAMRLKLDTKKNQIIMFDPAKQNIATITYKPVDLKENIKKDDPLVKDKKFPAVDKDKKTVTLYSGRQKMLVVIEVPEEYMAWPAGSWDAGDEVRIYYKEAGKAIKFMNITKTDIYKK